MLESVDRRSVISMGEAMGIGLLAFILGAIGSAIAAVVLGTGVGGVTQISPEQLTGTMIAQYAGTVAVGAVYLWYRGWSWDKISLQWPRISDAIWAVGGLILLFVVVGVASYAVQQAGLGVSEHSLLDAAEENPAILLPGIPLSILLVGPVEELLYRGIIHTRLQESFGSVGTLSIATTIFMLVHVPAYYAGSGVESAVPSLVIVFLLGGVLGGLYEVTGNLSVPIVVHGVYNAITFASSYLQVTSSVV